MENRYAAEREAAKAKGLEYAVPCELGVSWDAGAPEPHLLCNGQKAFLIFLVNESDPTWKGKVQGPVSENGEPLAVVEFVGATVKFGGPNDEVLHGHPLYGKGLQHYGAHYVLNSRWARELEEINKVHDRYDPARWKDLKHYLFAFHDETVEFLARGHKVEVHQTSVSDLLGSVVRRLIP